MTTTSSNAVQDGAGNSQQSAVWVARLDEPVPIGPVIYFRIVFGLAMLAWTTKYIAAGWVDQHFIEPDVFFKFPGFSWIGPWPGDGMRWQFYALAAAAIALTIGLAYRASALLVASAFTHAFLVDKSLYLNHHYLMCLLAWVAVALPGGRALSIDALLRPSMRSSSAPAWTVWLLRFQIAVPYIYGGIAKLEHDWLHGQPMRAVLATKANLPVIGPMLQQEWCLWLIVYGGLLFDLLIVPALLWRKTRPLAFVLAVAFHLTNAALFNIGVFPWLMALLTVLFFPADLLQRLLRLDNAHWPGKQQAAPKHTQLRHRTRNVLLIAYVAIQLLVPLRHLIYPGPANWTEQGHDFAWHMMLRGKQSALRLYATDPNSGRTGTIDLREYLREHQTARVARDPALIYQLCQYIADDLAHRGHGKVEIRALSLVSLNGRKPQLLIDPTVNLAAAAPGINCKWIVPLTEPLRTDAWNVPLDQWEQHLELLTFL